MTEEIGSVSDPVSEALKRSSENEIQKTSEGKCLNTDSSDEVDEECRNEMLLTYRHMCFRRRIANRYSNSLVNLE